MKSTLHAVALLAAAASIFSPPDGRAAVLTLKLGADDYGALYVDGSLIGVHDDFFSGFVIATLDLAPGWHDLRIEYSNRWGSNGLGLYRQYQGDAETLVPRSDFRSFDAGGTYIQGLRADYDGGLTVYGEAPVRHGLLDFGWTWYQNEPGLWAGVYDGWATFSETLTGQIRVVPEVEGWALAGLGLLGWAALRTRRH